jgi:hypothetical protein
LENGFSANFNQEAVAHIPRERFILPKSQRTSYRNILGGIYKATQLNHQVKFVTFTTSDECANQESFNSNTLSRDFEKLTKQVVRLTPKKLVDDGYLTKRQTGQFYGAGNYELKVFQDLSYFKVHTSEGNGVIHSLLRSPYLPYEYINDLWTDLHISFNVNIQNLDLNSYSVQECAGYIVAQYIAHNQGTSYLYSSQSKNWLFPGANKLWNDLKCTTLKDSNDYYMASIKITPKISRLPKSKVLKKAFTTRIHRWVHPYFQDDELSEQYTLLLYEWQKAIDESITNPNYHYPPDKTNPNDLTDYELQKLELDVINTLYKDSRINPSVALKSKKPNLYFEFLENRLGDQTTGFPTDKELDEFYQVGKYINYGDDDDAE